MYGSPIGMIKFDQFLLRAHTKKHWIIDEQRAKNSANCSLCLWFSGYTIRRRENPVFVIAFWAYWGSEKIGQRPCNQQGKRVRESLHEHDSLVKNNPATVNCECVTAQFSVDYHLPPKEKIHAPTFCLAARSIYTALTCCEDINRVPRTECYCDLMNR